MSKHTPGPWIASPESNGIEWGVDAGRWGIAICADAPGPGTAEANAKVIAAAPELLVALRKVVSEVGNQLHPATYEEARAAIAKATGERL